MFAINRSKCIEAVLSSPGIFYTEEKNVFVCLIISNYLLVL